MIVEIRIHGDNAKAEFGAYPMSIQDANSYVGILKGSDWFQCQGEWLKVKEIVADVGVEETILNIYTQIT